LNDCAILLIYIYIIYPVYTPELFAGITNDWSFFEEYSRYT
jgi:hypothetical protein